MLITGLIIGAVLGLVLQRGRFCITGAFRDLWVSHSSRWFTAFLLAITIQALGVSLLTFLGVIAPEAPKLSVIATVLGSFLFGVGIVLALPGSFAGPNDFFAFEVHDCQQAWISQ